MYCSKCGEQIDDEAVICPKCGCSTSKELSKPNQNQFADGKSKKTIGILIALFLGIVGLIIGLVLYPSGTEDRKTFLDGFWKTFAIEFGVLFFIILLLVIIGAFA